jgi:CheY-like chemotaxis protein
MSSVIALVDDLMFLSRIREAARGCEATVQAVRSVEELRAACRIPPRLVILDLDSKRLSGLEALPALRGDPALADVPVVGFLSHVEADLARRAREAGCTRVMARSAFVREVADLVAATAARPEP